MRRPLNAPISITQEFGARDVDYAQFGLVGHHGTDYQASVGRAVYAPEDATVVASSNGVTDKYTGRFASGETIILQGAYEHWLMHLSKRSVQAGQAVKEGDLIGYTGNTGYTTGPHLHWGVRPLSPDLNNGYRGFIDPWNVLQPPVVAPVVGNQRKVGSNGVNERLAPNTSAGIHKEWASGEILDFKGWVRGENYGGVDVWFVGAYNGRYFWAGAFTDSGTHDLPDLTPVVVVPPVVTPPVVVPPTVITYPVPTQDTLVTKVYNKKNPIGADYAPTDLVSLGTQQLRKEAADAMGLMVIAAYVDGITFNYGSGYRSYATQQNVYADWVARLGQAEADRQSARPGYSEHQTGLTMDFSPIDTPFETLPAFTWLVNNGHKFGWVLRYPNGSESITGYMYEPWHWRYVGVAMATDMYNKGEKTLEQYSGIPGGLYPDQEPVTPPVVVPPVVVPPVIVVPDPDKDAKAEAAKLLGRQGVLAALSALITAIADWAVMQLVGINLPREIVVSLAATAYAGLLYLDKYIHENVKFKIKGLLPF